MTFSEYLIELSKQNNSNSHGVNFIYVDKKILIEISNYIVNLEIELKNFGLGGPFYAPTWYSEIQPKVNTFLFIINDREVKL